MPAESPSFPPPPLAADLARRYCEPQRHYHTLAHIEAMLAHFDSHRALAQQADWVRAAIWFHDAIYDPTRGDNEARSAALAASSLRALGWSDVACKRVAALIELTARHEAPAADGDAALLIDLDLSILAAAPATYERYVAQVRREYGHVSDADFRAGRHDFVAAQLARERIFSTPQLHDVWEAPARENLRRELIQRSHSQH